MNWLRGVRHALFPSPRRPVAFWDVWPLLLFGIVFAGLVIWLEWSDRILFERPVWFALLLLTPWIWWMGLAGGAGLTKTRGVLSVLTRLTLFGLLVMVLAEPRSVRKNDSLSVVYALDISDSIGSASVDAARMFFARTVSQKPMTDRAGLVVFGANAAVEFPPRPMPPPDDTAINSLIDGDGTNLEQALSLSAAMIPADSRGRVVLISDGNSTDGSLSRILDDFKSRDITVDVLPIAYEFEEEVWLDRLELPPHVKLGENYQATVILEALQNGQGQLLLRENGDVIFDQEVQFQQGKNRFTIPIALREPGYYEYTATIEPAPGADHLAENNTVAGYLFMEGEGKVLLVTAPDADPRDADTLRQTLLEAERHVEQMSALELPRDVLALMSYDCIMFVNVPSDALNPVQMQAIHDSVKNLGIGFVMIGGPNSFGPGGYHHTQIEEALPVTMDVTNRQILPKAALAIILHTCEFPEGNTWGKRITKEAIRVLGAQDEVGVLAYTQNGEEWIFELTPAGNFSEFVPLINNAQIGDMPSFANTMSLGLKGLLASDAATRHMIIISDGDPSNAPPDLVKQFIDAKISISTVAVFPHTPSDIRNMRAVSNVTGGNFYFPSDPNTLPQIFIREAKTLRRTMIQNEKIQPEFERGLHPVLKGIDQLPPLYGYTIVSAKSKPAEVLLNVPSDPKVAPGEFDPILSVWQYGLGRSAAFMSDLSPNWGKDWLGWSQFEPFVKQLVQHVSRVEKQGHLRVSTQTERNTGVIIAEDFHPEEMFLDVTATILGPGNRSETLPLTQVGPRRYQAQLSLWGKGRYQVLVHGQAGTRSEQVPAGFIVPYSPEYLRFRSNPIGLREIADRTGGQMLAADTTPEEIYPTERVPRLSSSAVFDWFLVALACLLPLDIAIRRIQIDWAALRDFLRRPSTAQADQTMDRLLKRQRDSRESDAVTTATSARPFIPRPAAQRPISSPPSIPGGTARSEKTQPKPTAQPPAKGGAEQSSTMGRLLERKRRRDEHNTPRSNPDDSNAGHS